MMTADEMIDQIEMIFPDAQCELLHETPFQLLVAVVLSAQTTDASVNKVTPALFEKWPDCESMMNADLKEVEEAIHTIGLYRTKAKNIISLSYALHEQFNSEVPSTFAELQSLPGVGRYFCTARNPKCGECPFANFCKKEKLAEYNKAKKAKPAKTADV